MTIEQLDRIITLAREVYCRIGLYIDGTSKCRGCGISLSVPSGANVWSFDHLPTCPPQQAVRLEAWAMGQKKQQLLAQ